MNDNYKTLQALILASEGKTLEDELEFGCLVRHLSGLEFGMDDGEYLLRMSEKDRPVQVGEWESKTGYAIYGKQRDLPITEILGKDIGLSRLLITLSKKWLVNLTVPLKDGAIYCTKGNPNSEEYQVKSFPWNLNLPLHLQSEETITKLIEILK